LKRSKSLCEATRLATAAVLLLVALQSCATPENDLVAARHEWTVMATALTVTAYRPVSSAALAVADLDAAYREVADVDRLMSLYRADSELVALNARAGGGPVTVSAAMFEVLSAAQRFAVLSGGAFDITVQPVVDLWGFYRVERTAVPPQAAIDEALKSVGSGRIALDPAARTATLAPGTRIDLGAIAKGYAVDRALDALRARGASAALVNLGGNIGVFGPAPRGQQWSIGIQDPRANRLMGRIQLSAGAVATSGDYDRYFELDGKRYGHIIDPRTGWPVESVAATTVVAPTAMAADALSTAVFVLGPERGLALLKTQPGTAGVVVPADTDKPAAVYSSPAAAIAVDEVP
jgi:thiamine biosynthesis lipoprotein ApbE